MKPIWKRNPDLVNTDLLSQRVLTEITDGKDRACVNITYCEGSQSYVAIFGYDSYCKDDDTHRRLHTHHINVNDAKTIPQAEKTADKWLLDNNIS